MTGENGAEGSSLQTSRGESLPPLFSVVIPAYNAAVVLPKSLASVARQTFTGFEVIVVDDGSRDETASVAQSSGNDMPVTFLQQENRGAATARNTGAAVAHGRYLLFLDADDEAKPQWLERIAERVADGDPQVVCCGYELGEGSFTGIVRGPRDLGPAFYGYRGLFIPGTYALRREVFDSIGGFVDGLPYGEHSELALRITRYGRDAPLEIVSIDEPLIVKHHDRSPQVVAGYDRARFAGATYNLEFHADQLGRDPGKLANHHAIAGVASARLGDYPAARRHLRKAFGLRRRPRDLGRYTLSLMPPLASRVWFRHD